MKSDPTDVFLDKIKTNSKSYGHPSYIVIKTII